MARTPTKPVPSNSLSHESIADDIAAFRKRGGRIEILGNTPLRTTTPTAFRSSTTERKPAAGERRKRAG